MLTDTDSLHGRDTGRPDWERLLDDRELARAVPGSGPAPALAADRGGGEHSAPGSDAAAAPFRGAAAGLTQAHVLPRLPADLPRVLRLPRPELRAATLAEALLAEGILQETDWQGAVIPSIGAGLTRWVGEILGGRDLERITWGLFWTDDLQACSGIETRLWLESGKGRDPGEPVGLLAIQSELTDEDRYPYERDVIVGPAVLELEAAQPGLGFQVLRLLQEVLPAVLCVACPFWGLEQTIKSELMWGAIGDRIPRQATEIRYDELGINLVPSQHGVTPEAFLSTVPEAACRGEYRPGVIREALRHPLEGRLGELVELAAEVDRLRRIPRDAFRWDTHVLCPSQQSRFIDVPGAASVEAPFALRWSAEDPMPLLVQDYHRQIRRHDDSTNLIWSQGWQAKSPESLRKTVRHFRQIVTLALRASLLAERLHCAQEN